MDLSKAFDCLPHNLLMLRLEACGLSENSLKLLKSYLENRRQRIKIGNNYSEWDTFIKGSDLLSDSPIVRQCDSSTVR